MNDLGLLYEEGVGVKADLTEALRWYRAAAERGDVKAQSTLGSFYLDGRGVPSDLVQAYVWFKLSAANGSGVGRKYLIDYKQKELLNPAQLAEADKLFKEYQGKFATNRSASIKLGRTN